MSLGLISCQTGSRSVPPPPLSQLCWRRAARGVRAAQAILTGLTTVICLGPWQDNLLEQHAGRINNEGTLSVTSEKTRSQVSGVVYRRRHPKRCSRMALTACTARHAPGAQPRQRADKATQDHPAGRASPAASICGGAAESSLTYPQRQREAHTKQKEDVKQESCAQGVALRCPGPLTHTSSGNAGRSLGPTRSSTPSHSLEARRTLNAQRASWR
jgi:hypothetical protein